MEAESKLRWVLHFSLAGVEIVTPNRLKVTVKVTVKRFGHVRPHVDVVLVIAYTWHCRPLTDTATSEIVPLCLNGSATLGTTTLKYNVSIRVKVLPFSRVAHECNATIHVTERYNDNNNNNK